LKTSFHLTALVCLFLLLCSTFGQSQNQSSGASDYQIAMQFYRDGEFQKASELFQKLYLTNRTQTYFQYYLNSLVSLKEFEKAEGVLKEQIKTDKNELSYWVELGYIYSLQKNENKAKASYQGAIKKLRPDQNQIIRLANAFNSKRLYPYTEETYLEGKKLLNGNYGFEMEMAQLYYYMRDYDKMIGSYLDILKLSDMYLQSVQNQLQNAVYNDIDNSLKEKLKEHLLIRINQYPNIVVYSELLIWLYIQDEDLEGAFIQARALDLRLKENGQRLIALARVAADKNNFDIAMQAYDYVIQKGRFLEFYFAAREEMLQVMYLRIVQGLDNHPDDYKKLENALITALQEMGTNMETVDMVKNLAHLQAFYLGKTASARFLLEEAIAIPRLSFTKLGELKLEMADIYLLDGEVWDATFIYAQIEEDNKENPIGSEAKYRKSRLAYFIGDFEWARAQLDVLKASTSKLIANDAADLALFIYENTGWDTVETALETYARADLLFYQAKDSLALLTLDTVLSAFKDHELADDAWLLKGKILQKNLKYGQAIEAYQFIVDNFGHDILADNALYAMAEIYEKQLHNNEKALDLYKKIMMDYPDSIFKIESRNRFRKLRGDNLAN